MSGLKDGIFWSSRRGLHDVTHDPQSGFRVAGRQALETIPFVAGRKAQGGCYIEKVTKKVSISV